jgi:hypothetical protein
MSDLKNCPFCNGTPIFIQADNFHFSFAYENLQDEIEIGFYNHGAIYCQECALTLPVLDEGEKEFACCISMWNGLR